VSTTVTTVTTITLSTAAAGSLALIVMAAFLLLLIKREAIAGLSAAWAERLRQALGIAVPSLALVFVVAVVARIAVALSQ